MLGKHFTTEPSPSPQDLILSLRDDVFVASLVYIEFQANHGYRVSPRGWEECASSCLLWWEKGYVRDGSQLPCARAGQAVHWGLGLGGSAGSINTPRVTCVTHNLHDLGRFPPLLKG